MAEQNSAVFLKGTDLSENLRGEKKTPPTIRQNPITRDGWGKGVG